MRAYRHAHTHMHTLKHTQTHTLYNKITSSCCSPPTAGEYGVVDVGVALFALPIKKGNIFKRCHTSGGLGFFSLTFSLHKKRKTEFFALHVVNNSSAENSLASDLFSHAVRTSGERKMKSEKPKRLRPARGKICTQHVPSLS